MPTDPKTTDPTEINDSVVGAKLKERFDTLPKVVQDAIKSADLQKQMRAVADNHKLHLDQWGVLENEVMLTLLGFQEPKDLAANIQSEVGVSAEDAASLAGEISNLVFEPIRAELERALFHPEAKAAEISPEEAARQAFLATESAPAPQATPTDPANTSPTPQPVTPATPPAPPPTEKALRAPISASYTSRQASSERKGVEGDPYREPPA